MLHITEDICVPISAIKTRSKTIHDAMRRIKVAYGRSQAAFSGKSYSLTRSIERRDDVRSPVEIPIFIHPVSLIEDQVKYEQTQPVMGLTQDISSQGLGYSYDEPLRGRYAVIEVDLFNSGPLKLLVERRWHRKVESHAYVGGAVVIGILS